MNKLSFSPWKTGKSQECPDNKATTCPLWNPGYENMQSALRGFEPVCVNVRACVDVCTAGVWLTVREFDPPNRAGISAAKTYLSDDYRSAYEPDSV